MTTSNGSSGQPAAIATHSAPVLRSHSKPAGFGVVVVGSLNADLTITTHRLPSAGETVAGSDFATRPGGKGANQAVAAARLGSAVSLIGAIGDDANGRMLMQAARGNGITTDSIVVIADTPTGVAVIEVDADGENSIVVFPGANGQFTPHHVEQEAERIAAAAVVCLCLESPLETVLAAARQGHQGGATVILNLSPFQQVPTDLLAVADLLLVNEHEAAQLLGSTDLALDWAATARGFKAAGVRDVIVTLGARGSMVIQSGPENLAVLTPIPAVPAHVVDTTGCGDAFTGALADSLARGVDLLAAARRAAAVASIAAAAEGAQDSYPTRDETAAIANGAPVECQRRPLVLGRGVID